MSNLTIFILLSLISFHNAFMLPPMQSSRLKVFMSSMSGSDDSKQVALSIAERFALSFFGDSEPSILAETFLCLGPNLKATNKKTYLNSVSKEFSAIRRAIPDITLNPYAFEVDELHPDTVWFKTRTKGTISGPFAYKGDVYVSQQRTIEFPLVQHSVIVKDGKIAKATTGFVIDKFSGTTGGLNGPDGILFAMGKSISPFDISPPALVVKQFIARTKKVSLCRGLRLYSFGTKIYSVSLLHQRQRSLRSMVGSS